MKSIPPFKPNRSGNKFETADVILINLSNDGEKSCQDAKSAVLSTALELITSWAASLDMENNCNHLKGLPG
jgi:hypothetical protein